MQSDVFVLSVFAFILGSIIGSFLNVCIYRIPEGKSLVTPASHCPRCGEPIRWFDNIPIFGWLLLRGRCRYCRGLISFRYPLIEFMVGLLYVSIYVHFVFLNEVLFYWVLSSLLVVISFVDLDYFVIPNRITLPGICAGVVLGPVLGVYLLTDLLLGLFIGGAVLYSVASAYEVYLLFRGQIDFAEFRHCLSTMSFHGLGGGDVKLLAMLGAFLGWQAVMPIVFMASLSGTVVALPRYIMGRGSVGHAIPFGPFLSLGALLYLFFWADLLSWYVSLWGGVV